MPENIEPQNFKHKGLEAIKTIVEHFKPYNLISVGHYGCPDPLAEIILIEKSFGLQYDETKEFKKEALSKAIRFGDGGIDTQLIYTTNRSKKATDCVRQLELNHNDAKQVFTKYLAEFSDEKEKRVCKYDYDRAIKILTEFGVENFDKSLIGKIVIDYLVCGGDENKVNQLVSPNTIQKGKNLKRNKNVEWLIQNPTLGRKEHFDSLNLPEKTRIKYNRNLCKQLIKEGDLVNAYKIANECGFDDATYLKQLIYPHLK